MVNNKEYEIQKLIPKRFVSDAMRNGINRNITESKERIRRLEYENKWIGNPQYGKYSMLLGFRKWVRDDSGKIK